MKYRSPAVAVAVCILSLVLPAAAETQSVTLAWDPSPEASVTGYVVYVGSVSGAYDEQYDAGNRASFVYDKVINGRAYYFAVAAYSADRSIGPRSDEIAVLAGTAAALQTALSTPRAREGSTDAHVLCAAGGDGGCYSVEPLASVDGVVSALTPASDGRLFFLEDQRSVRVMQDGRLILAPAWTAEPGTTLEGLVLDPEFERNRFVYVLEVRKARNGREASVVRYREIANELGEGAAIVAALPLPAARDAAMTIDAAGRLYIAVPEAIPGFEASAYGGRVLRFERDGKVPVDSPARSPVFADGFAQPVAIASAGTGNTLWLAGAEAGRTPQIAQLSLEHNAEWPRIPSPAHALNTAAIISMSAVSARVVLVDPQGYLLLVETTQDGADTIGRLSLAPLGGMPLAVAFGRSHADDELFVAIDASTQSSPGFSRIFRLQH